MFSKLSLQCNDSFFISCTIGVFISINNYLKLITNRDEILKYKNAFNYFPSLCNNPIL